MAIDFKNHEYGKEVISGEIVNGCSIGLNRILNKLVEWHRKNIKHDIDTVLVNIYTVIRNCYNKTDSDKEIIRKVGIDIDMLKLYIDTYFTNINKQVVTIFYLPKYYLPKEHMRELNSTNSEIERLRKIVLSHWTNEDIIDISTPTMKAYLVVFNTTKMTPRALSDTIRQFSNMGSRSKLWLISHIPLDFHLHRLIKDISLFESYTAELKVAKFFGEKVFKHNRIPFNQYTHLALGDSIYVQPLVKGKQKKEIISRAEQVNWNIRTEHEILLDLVKCGVPRKLLETLKLY